MRRLVVLCLCAVSLSACSLLGSDAPRPQPTAADDLLEDFNEDLVAFRCTASEDGWVARGRVTNTAEEPRSYLVIAYAGEPGVEVNASTIVIEDLEPGGEESFGIDDVLYYDDAQACFVRLEPAP